MPGESTHEQAIESAVRTVKTLAMDAVERANSGHPGTPMGLARIAVELFAHYLRYDPKDPAWLARDRFVLSAGHASMLLYSMLHLSGYPVTLEDLKEFRQWGSKTPGHPEHGHTPGVETTTGPLGQGVGNAVGLALAAKMAEARFGASVSGVRVFCIASDGDIMEGVSGEASSLAGHLALDNLVVIYDDNRITIEGETGLAFSEDVGARYAAYGWDVIRIDGHDSSQIRDALTAATTGRKKPTFIVARTNIAHGAPNAQDTAESHGAPLGAAEIAATKAAMGLDPQASFQVPAEVYRLFQERHEALGQDYATHRDAVAAWRERDRGSYEAFSRGTAGNAESLLGPLLSVVPPKADATRSLSNVVQQKAAERVPGLVGGSADLAPSTKTLIKGSESVRAGHYGGRNLHFGIREHAMGAVCNGIALFGGFVPYGSTFLVFSDYMRPSVRLSALMNLPCIWVYTHDSILLGEDGPTHQPVEHLWSLRMIPNLKVFRPADGAEVAAAWAMALGGQGPSAFSLTRQKVSTLARHENFSPNDMLRGAYVVADAKGSRPSVVIMATGSEVQLALDVRSDLASEGVDVRVVSALCIEVFARQDSSYRDTVLPPGVPRVSIEAGLSEPFRAWVGDSGLRLGIDTFGASAKDSVLADKFGFTHEQATNRVRAWLSRPPA